MEKHRGENLKWWNRTVKPLRKLESQTTNRYLSSGTAFELHNAPKGVLEEDIVDLTEDATKVQPQGNGSDWNQKISDLQQYLEASTKQETKKTSKRKAENEVIFSLDHNL